MISCYVVALKSTKKSEKSATPDEIHQFVKNKQDGYEIIKAGQPVMPYFDGDFYHESEVEMLAKFESDRHALLNELSTCYPIFDNTKIKLILFTSNGFDTDHKKWKNSIHVLLRGAGYFTSNQDIVKPATGIFDNTVYKPYQKFRLPFCSKKGQNRFKNLLYNGITYDINNFEESGLTFADLLITQTHGESEFIPLEPDVCSTDECSDLDVCSDSGSDDSGSDSGPDSDLKIDLSETGPVKLIYPFKTVKDFKNLTDLIDTKIWIANHKNWMKIMRVSKNIMKEFDDADTAKIRLIIHDLCKMDTRPNKYKAKEVDAFLDREDNKSIESISWGTLCRIAKECNEIEYQKLVDKKRGQSAKKPSKKPSKKPKKKPKEDKIPKDDIFNIQRIERLQREPVKYYWKDHKKFNNKNFKKPDEIIKYMTDSAFKINNGGKPFYITKDRIVKKLDKDKKPVYAYEMKTILNNPFKVVDKAVNFKINGEKYDLFKFSTEFFQKFSYDYSEMLPYSGTDDPYLHSEYIDDRIFNKFEAFTMASYEYKDKESATFDTMMYHIKSVICGDDKKVYDYLIGWLAYLIQFPERKHETCILLQSLEGAGKNMFIEIVKSLIGTHYCYDTADVEDIIGGFNYHLSGKLLVIGDELVGYAGFKKSDMIKGMTTAQNINITKKGVDTIQEASFQRYMFTTNNIETLRISNEDRRILVIGVSNIRIGDFDYFKKLKAEMNNFDNVKKLFDYLNAYDLSDFNFRKAPITALKKDMIVSQLDDIYDWFIDYVETHVSNGSKFYIKSGDAYESYAEYSKSNIRKKDFKTKLMRNIACEYKKINNTRQFIFNTDVVGDMLVNLMNLDENPFHKNSDTVYDSQDNED